MSEEESHPRYCAVCMEVHLPSVSGIPCSTCKKFVCERVLVRVDRKCPTCRNLLPIYVNMVDPLPIVNRGEEIFDVESDTDDGYMSDIIPLAHPSPVQLLGLLRAQAELESEEEMVLDLDLVERESEEEEEESEEEEDGLEEEEVYHLGDERGASMINWMMGKY